ncbi:hypothetical protein [Pseudoalteromonas aurantia]|uniref:DNA-binding protein n=2 Tax=Pseudoalteromonas TaxID=53246 RepID=A0ABY2VZQ0_9GAMM|nr:hypothetical protein [Pseudoalteromonas aurantia]TMO60644.1 hypothetical protein CWC18_13365 [Pseudoalteromonas aurantia]TMO76087.1 hypothetical protein CWC20_06180 [Pseudoalteromonas aurantia]
MSEYNFSDKQQLESLRQLIVKRIEDGALSSRLIEAGAFLTVRSISNYKKEGYLADKAPLNSGTAYNLLNLLNYLKINTEEALEFHSQRLKQEKVESKQEEKIQRSTINNNHGNFEGNAFLIQGVGDVTLHIGSKE